MATIPWALTQPHTRVQFYYSQPAFPGKSSRQERKKVDNAIIKHRQTIIIYYLILPLANFLSSTSSPACQLLKELFLPPSRSSTNMHYIYCMKMLISGFTAVFFLLTVPSFNRRATRIMSADTQQHKYIVVLYTCFSEDLSIQTCLLYFFFSSNKLNLPTTTNHECLHNKICFSSKSSSSK